MTNKDFLGKGWSFPFRFNRSVGGLKKTEGTSTSSDVQKVKESLSHIFSVAKGERPMRRAFGYEARSLVFENNDAHLKLWFDLYVRRAVETWEPRCTILNVEIDRTDRVKGIAYVNIEFRIISTNVKGNLVYPFYLQG